MKYIGYIRCSTNKQEKSGLGLSAQEAALTNYIDQQPDAALLEMFIEVESGKKNDRPKLLEAIALCKKHKATLIVSKICRLGRSVQLISTLMNSDIELAVVDNPNANRFFLHLMAAFSEHEREMISTRTKEALAAAKAKGTKLGSYGVVLGARKKETADLYAKSIEPVIKGLKDEGCRTIKDIMEQLNSRGIKSPGGGFWHLCSVHRLLHRLEDKRI